MGSSPTAANDLRQFEIEGDRVGQRHDLRWVVPGHGRPLTPEEAAAVGASDLAYLEDLARAVGEAEADGLEAGRALLHVFGVEPPRETTPDFEIYALRSANARSVLANA